MQTLWQDMRYGARALARQPGFTLIAVLTLALGIGANTAVFSVIDATLLHPLPFAEPEQLMEINDGAGRILNLWPEQEGGELLDWREPVTAFASVASYDSARANLNDMGTPERVQLLQVTPSFFPLLRVAPVWGRLFNEAEVRGGAHRLLVLSHGLWQRRFGGDKHLLGQTVRLNGVGFTVVGVLPRTFDYQPYGERPEAFIPLLPNDTLFVKEAVFNHVIARLRPGVTPMAAQIELNTIAARLTEEERAKAQAADGAQPEVRPIAIKARPLNKLFGGQLEQPLWMLLCAVGCVLLIACANVANLLLARAVTRQKEVAVRAAVGASRWRLMRQWLTESGLLAVAGGALGLLLSAWLVDALTAIYPEPLTRLATPHIDARALFFSSAVTLLTGLVFGSAPALQYSRSDLTQALKEGGQHSNVVAGPRLRQVLLVTQIALALALLSGAGLLVKSLQRTIELRAGFRAQQVLTLELAPAPGEYADEANRARLYQQIIARLRVLPGVISVGAGNHLPFSPTGGLTIMPLKVVGRAGNPDWSIGGVYRVASGDYFRALNLPLRAGRLFDERDADASSRSVIINESLARQAFPNGDAIGQLVMRGSGTTPYEIVGVVGNSEMSGIGGNLEQEFYLALGHKTPGFLRLALQTAGESTALVNDVRAVVQQVEPELPIYNVKTMETILTESAAPHRFATLLLSAFALAALLLAAAGVYGVMAYLVAQRTHEIGVRLALGAQRADVVRLVLRQALHTTLLGAVIGLGLALLLSLWLAEALYGVRPFDPPAFVVAMAMMISAALLACWLPARRATKVDPMIALRHE